MSGETYHGRCLCGAVEFEVYGFVGDVSACHCGQCRRQSGHFVVAADVPRDDFELIEDRGLRWFRSSDFARRGFCSECGSVLLWDADGSGTISVNIGSLDQPTGLKLASHIFVADKADYYEIEDDLPQFEGSQEPD